MGQLNENPMKRRNAFTLVELLVAITIFVILTVLTLGAFNLNIGSERVRSASRQVQAMLEGAKTRAFKDRNPVGVRFLLNENFPGEITGMMYIEGQANLAGGSFETGSLHLVDLVLDGDSNDGMVDQGIKYAVIQGTTSLSWKEMKSIGQIQAGVRIRIPAKTGKWYTVSSNRFLTDTNESIMRLTEDYVGSANWVLSNATFAEKSVTYELDLSMVMGAMPGEDPVELPNGIVIDLKSSKVPSNWNVTRWRPSKLYAVGNWVVGNSNAGLRAYRAENAGTSAANLNNEPTWPSAVNNTVIDNGITWRCFEVPRFDIVFTPQGTVMGSVVAEGLLHLTLAETRDTHAIFENDPTASGGTTIGVPVWDLRDHNGDNEAPEHIGSFRVITVFPASGSVNVSPIDQTDSDNNEFADSIFRYAIEGSTAK